MLSFHYRIKNVTTLYTVAKIQPLLNIAEAEAPNSTDIWLESASVNTEVITRAYANTFVWPHCSFCILMCPQIAAGWLPDWHKRKISRQQSVFLPSPPSLESTLPPVIREANSAEALKSKLAIYLFSLRGRGVLQFLLLPQPREH